MCHFTNSFDLGQQLAAYECGAHLPDQHLVPRSSIRSRKKCYDFRRCKEHRGRRCEFTPCRRCTLRVLTTGWLRPRAPRSRSLPLHKLNPEAPTTVKQQLLPASTIQTLSFALQSWAKVQTSERPRLLPRAFLWSGWCSRLQSGRGTHPSSHTRFRIKLNEKAK